MPIAFVRKKVETQCIGPMVNQEFPKGHKSSRDCAKAAENGVLPETWYSETYAVLNELALHLPKSHDGAFHPGIADAPFNALFHFAQRLLDETPFGLVSDPVRKDAIQSAGNPHGANCSNDFQSAAMEIRFSHVTKRFRQLVDAVRQASRPYHLEKAEMLDRLMRAIHVPDDRDNWQRILKLASVLEDSGIPYQYNLLGEMTELVTSLSDHIMNPWKFQRPDSC